MLEDLQQDRDRLLTEIQTLKKKEVSSKLENKAPSTNLSDLNSDRDEFLTRKNQRDNAKDKATSVSFYFQ